MYISYLICFITSFFLKSKKVYDAAVCLARFLEADFSDQITNDNKQITKETKV